MKKITIIGLLVFCVNILAVPVFALNLGDAGDYNAFIFGDFNGANSDTGGRLAAGGNVSVTSYDVGGGLTYDNTETKDTLVVGGNLTYHNGEVSNGNAVVGGSVNTSEFTVTEGTLKENSSISIDFSKAEEYLKGLSIDLAKIASTGTAVNEYGTMCLTGDDVSDFLVFDMGFSGITGFSISGVPNNATMVINVSGTSVNISNFGMDVPDGYNILFNCYEAETLTINSAGINGSILAPFADVYANNSQMSGTIIAKSWDGTMELHDKPFKETVPEPGTMFLLSSGLIGIFGLKRKRGN